MPLLDGHLQPTCALYKREAFDILEASVDENRLMAWLAELDVRTIEENEPRAIEIDPAWLCGCNTAAGVESPLSRERNR